MSKKTAAGVSAEVEVSRLESIVLRLKKYAKQSFMNKDYMVLGSGIGTIHEPEHYEYDSPIENDRLDIGFVASSIIADGENNQLEIGGKLFYLVIGKEKDRFNNGKPVAGWAILFKR